MSKQKRVGNVLAEGEVTGHAHRVGGADVVKRPDGVREFAAPDGETVTHEEHGPVTLPPSVYESAKVREFDHAAEGARAVAD